MKKLGNGTGRKVHPAPPQDHLAALPAAVLALATALTAEEQEVLAYLLSGGGRWREQRRRLAHPPELGCGCFGCYKIFWSRWDASPNRHVIHRIIDAVEESLETRERDRGGSRRRRRRQSGGGGGRKGGAVLAAAAAAEAAEEEGKGLPPMEGGRLADDNGDDYDDEGSVYDFDDDDAEDEEDDEEEEEMNGGGSSNNGNKSSVRRFMSFIGESVWAVWN